MKNKLTLYHGSQNIVKKPIYGEGNPKNDYGLGFYCTESLELAKEWACDQDADGFANVYSYDLTGLSVLNLTGGDYNILNRLFVLLENRTFSLDSDIIQMGKDYISENFSIGYKKYDVIKGYRADDSYFSFARDFLNNNISISKLEEAMALGELGEQVVAVSKKAFSRFKYEGAQEALNEIYYPKRMARDEKAREDYKKARDKEKLLGEKYLLDIMREGWKNDDERLQRIVLK